MNCRRSLVYLCVALIITGIILALVPFLKSLSITDSIESKYKVKIALSDIPEQGAIEADYLWTKLFIVRNPIFVVFSFPYYDGAYQLPDPTWERAIIPCKKIVSNHHGFYCEDRSLHENILNEAQWELSGKSKGTWMSDLERIPYRIKGKYIVVSPKLKE